MGRSSFLGKGVGAPSPEPSAVATGSGGPGTGQEFHSLKEECKFPIDIHLNNLKTTLGLIALGWQGPDRAITLVVSQPPVRRPRKRGQEGTDRVFVCRSAH